MSYCRFTEADVYAYPTQGGGMDIFVARSPEDRPHAGATFQPDTLRYGVQVLRMLKIAGWDIPEDVIDEVERDADDQDREVAETLRAAELEETE